MKSVARGVIASGELTTLIPTIEINTLINISSQSVETAARSIICDVTDSGEISVLSQAGSADEDRARVAEVERQGRRIYRNSLAIMNT